MRIWKFTMISVGSLLLALALTTAAGAQQRKQTQFRNNVAAALEIRDFVENLRLSDMQRQEARAILKAHKSEILVASENLIRARIALLNKDSNAPKDFGAAQAGIMRLKQAIADQIEAKLTPEQLTALQKKRQRQADLLNRRLQRLGGI